MELMLIDMNCYDNRPPGIDVSLDLRGPGSEDTYADIEPETTNNSATLVLLARRADASSVCVTVSGYRPWVRLISKSEDYDISVIKSLILKDVWNLKDVTIVRERLSKFYGFVASERAESKKFFSFKVYLPTFAAASRLESLWKRPSSISNLFELTDHLTPQSVKAMNEIGLEPSGWLTVAEHQTSVTKISTCGLDIETDVKHIAGRPDLTSIAPIKILSFDAEMYSHDNGFPEVINGDYTVAICATIKTYGSSKLERHAFVLWTKEPLEIKTPAVVMHYCDTQGSLLDSFRDLVVHSDPDLITGWNIYGFDMPFLWDQYASAHIPKATRGSEELHSELLRSLGRHVNFKTAMELINLSKADRSHNAEVRHVLSTVDMRWRMKLKKSKDLPEYVAGPLRQKLRKILNMSSESEDGCSIGGQEDYAVLKKNFESCFVGPSGPTTNNSSCGSKFKSTMEPSRLCGTHRRFEYMSRMCAERSKLFEKRMSSSAKGDNTYYFWTGRSCVDLMQIIKDDKKLDDNTLKHTAQQFLDPDFGKIDMTPAEIFKSFRESDATKMAAMIDYCIRDADIPIALIDRLSYVPIWIEMSRVTFTPLHQVLNGGQQRRVYNTIARFVHGTHALNKSDAGWPVSAIEADSDGLEIEDALKKLKPDYQGATVIEPKTGFYTEAVSTLDFESLYPSIMIHFNLCPSVYVGPDSTCQQLNKIQDSGIVSETHTIHHNILTEKDTYREFDRTYTFVKNVQGVVPKLLQHLLAARKIAKREMARATDDFERSVQNGRQLALKVSCNSVYGFFGVSMKKGLMSCKPVAAVTTLKGRAFIEASKNYVEKSYAGSDVLYGDTDSIMIKWGPQTSISEAYALAEEASAEITELLRSGTVAEASRPMLSSATCAITLANEKVYCPYLLIQKKTYAGFKYTLKSHHKNTSIDDFDGCIDMKGIDAVRRDRSKLVKNLSEKVLDALLIKRDLNFAIQELQETLVRVADQKAPLEWITLSKSLKSSYHSENQPHVQAWRRMGLRGLSEIPEIGTRMPYIIVAPKHGAKNGPLYERSEHPDYFLSAGLKYDAKYYLENAKDVILRLLGPTGQGPQVLKFFDDSICRAESVASGIMSLNSFKKRKL